LGHEESARDTGDPDDDARSGTIARAYFVALAEWHLTPHYINEEWSPELLWLMFHERHLEIQRMRTKAEPRGEPDEVRRVVSDVELFKMMGIKTTRA